MNTGRPGVTNQKRKHYFYRILWTCLTHRVVSVAFRPSSSRTPLPKSDPAEAEEAKNFLQPAPG
ncbi:unnamed protein product [Protopolystoma xenopodis]|uniref:Uncharacterized protein n=1 Tax=Protopolystoma xenopodis TaxID=117903 RepID=A0A3S5AKB3_9PLAT|nr:unnamed protein product [Protopolystoma xenopodis]